VRALRRHGVRTTAAGGWDDHDGTLHLSPFLRGQLQSSSHPIGYVQLRVRPRLRWLPLATVLATAAATALAAPALAVLVAASALAATAAALVRAARLLPRVLGSDA